MTSAARLVRRVSFFLFVLPSLTSIGLGCSGVVSGISDAGQPADAASAADAASGTDAGSGRDASTVSLDAGSKDGGAADGGIAGVVDGGLNTIAWNGGNFYLYGINYPWLTYGTDFGDGGFGHLANPTEVKADMATFASVGGHVLRWWVWVDGRYDPLFNGSGQVTGFDPLFFSDLDTELQYVANNHIYLDLTLFDTSVLDAAQSKGGVQEGGHRALVTDTTVQQSFLDNALKPLLQHIAGSS